MTTLRDALSQAFDKADVAVADEPAVEVSASPEPAVAESRDFHRDEEGKFASPKEDQPAEAKVDLPTTRKPPSSWKKDYWGHWEKVATNPELAPLADYIEQRESEFAKGVSTYRDEAMKAKALQDAIAPFVPEMQKYGVTPEVEVRNLLAAHHALVTSDPQRKLQMFAKLATDYGVPLQALNGQQMDPQSHQLLQEVQYLKSQFGQMYQTQQQRESAQIAQTIEQFKANAPHFEQVREVMAGLLQSGMVPDLQTAYDKAIRLDDNVWKQEQARQAELAAKGSQKRLAEKKATAVSPRSNAPTGRGSVAGGGKDLRSLLSAAIDQHTAGRL